MRTAIIVLFSSLLLFLGCGSGSMGPTPAPSPMPSPSPSPSPSAGTSDAFLSTWFFTVGRNIDPQGTITLDTSANNGSGNLEANLASDHTAFMLQFCPYPQGFVNCITVASVTTSASAFVNINFTFPEKGTFSGAFQIVDGNGTQSEITATGTIGTSFKSALLPAATITGGIGQTTGNSPGSGSAAMHDTTAHIMLSDAFPNHTFNTAVCPVAAQAACTILSNITTDAHGNASADVGTVPPQGGSIFRVSDSNGVQFVTAFRVQ